MRDTFTYLTESGQAEVVNPERWRWRAIYADGRELQQFNESNGYFHRLAEIDQSQLRYFIIESPFYHHSFTLEFNPDQMKLIHLQRQQTIFIQTGVSDKGEVEGFQHSERYTLFGYEANGVKYLQAVDASGNLYITDKLEGITRQKGLKKLVA